MQIRAHLLGATDLPSQVLALAYRMVPEMQLSGLNKASRRSQAHHMSCRMHSSKGQAICRSRLTRHFNRPVLECNEPIAQWLLIVSLMSGPLERLGPSKVPNVVAKRWR